MYEPETRMNVWVFFRPVAVSTGLCIRLSLQTLIYNDHLIVYDEHLYICICKRTASLILTSQYCEQTANCEKHFPSCLTGIMELSFSWPS